MKYKLQKQEAIMRKKTDKEKEILGQVEVILRRLKIDKNNAGYAPLLDAIVYAYAFPDEGLTEIIDMLSKENYYLGLHLTHIKSDLEVEINSESIHTVKTDIEGVDEQNLQQKNKKMDTRAEIYSEIVHTVKTAIEGGHKQYLKELQLDGLNVILHGKREGELEGLLLTEIGNKYRKYSNDEKIVLFFIKKILKAVKNPV